MNPDQVNLAERPIVQRLKDKEQQKEQQNRRFLFAILMFERLFIDVQESLFELEKLVQERMRAIDNRLVQIAEAFDGLADTESAIHKALEQEQRHLLKDRDALQDLQDTVIEHFKTELSRDNGALDLDRLDEINTIINKTQRKLLNTLDLKTDFGAVRGFALTTTTPDFAPTLAR